MNQRDERVWTPPVSIDAALWISTLEPGDIAYIAGAAMQRLAMSQGITEADLYAEWARRAADDPDCNVIRPA